MRLRIVDAFTERPFSGNPAGVCLLPAGDWPDESWMQTVALEMSQTETAFARPSEQTDADWELRWFTPTVEVDLCGHATLATTHALVEDGLVAGKVRYATRSGILTAEVAPDSGITLDFPAPEVAPSDVPAGLLESLGLADAEAFSTGSLGNVLVVVAEEQLVRDLAPDLGALEAHNRSSRLHGTIVTAPAADGAEYDFVSRFFAPAAGIPEDPVCGSAHTALGVYWRERLGKDELLAYQASRRGGYVRVTPSGDRVFLGGHAVTVLDGVLAPGLGVGDDAVGRG